MSRMKNPSDNNKFHIEMNFPYQEGLVGPTAIG